MFGWVFGRLWVFLDLWYFPVDNFGFRFFDQDYGILSDGVDRPVCVFGLLVANY
jgi:hypothetical protein